MTLKDAMTFGGHDLMSDGPEAMRLLVEHLAENQICDLDFRTATDNVFQCILHLQSACRELDEYRSAERGETR